MKRKNNFFKKSSSNKKYLHFNYKVFLFVIKCRTHSVTKISLNRRDKARKIALCVVFSILAVYSTSQHFMKSSCPTNKYLKDRSKYFRPFFSEQRKLRTTHIFNSVLYIQRHKLPNSQHKATINITFIISGLLANFSNLHALANPIPWIDER